MLKLLRKKGVMKKVIWAVVIVIIIAFGFGGTMYLLNSQAQGYAGKIFGQKISFEEYEKAFRDLKIQTILRYGDKFRDIEPLLNLEAETWDRLILLREVKKQKIRVSDQEVIHRIEQYPFFQRDGRFDQKLYNDILTYAFRITPRQFEESIRQTLKFEKLYIQKTKDISVSEEEAFDAYKYQNEKVQVSYVFVDPALFKNQVTITELQAEEYYNNNKLEFLQPPSINVEYVLIETPSEENDPDTETDSPEAIKTLQQKKEAARQKIETIYQQALISSRLAEAAKKYNMPVKTTGPFSMEQPNLSVGWSYEQLTRIFQMKSNDITEPMETDTGYLLAQIKEKKPAYVPPYAEIQDKVRAALIDQEAKNIARKKAEEYLNALYKEMAKTKVRDFPQSAKTLGLSIFQTPEFRRGQYLPKIGISKEFQDAAFALNDDNRISEVVSVDNGFCILHLDNYIPVEKSDFEKHKDDIIQALLNRKREKAFNVFLDTLKTKARLEDHIAKRKVQQKD